MQNVKRLSTGKVWCFAVGHESWLNAGFLFLMLFMLYNEKRIYARIIKG